MVFKLNVCLRVYAIQTAVTNLLPGSHHVDYHLVIHKPSNKLVHHSGDGCNAHGIVGYHARSIDEVIDIDTYMLEVEGSP